MNIHVSPSLQTAGQWAHEVKFALDRRLSHDVIQWATARMVQDTHNDPSLDGAYGVNTVYLDTPTQDVYHRNPGYRESKYRLRFYGDSGPIFVELKRKKGTSVMKTRTSISQDQVKELGCPVSEEVLTYDWFKIAVADLDIHPVCKVSYTRHAFNAMSPTGPIRLTLDDRLKASRVNGWELQGSTVFPVHSVQAILEIKFSEFLPAVFEDLIREFKLLPTSVSKYRVAIDTLTEVENEVKICPNF